MPDGILVVNKPQGMTSHDVVQLARRKLKIRRIGHAGTLDPMATGVLVLLVGGATKAQSMAQRHRKRYEAVIQLGTQTDTGDGWGLPIGTAPVPPLDRHQVEVVLASFIGQTTQVPPVFSAVKVHGRPLYWWARRGTRLTAPSRTIEIFTLELLRLTRDSIRCRMVCSAGTYIRSLAEAIATRLGTVGHVSELIRLAVGSWELSQALDIEWMKDARVEDLEASLQPTESDDAGPYRTSRA